MRIVNINIISAMDMRNGNLRIKCIKPIRTSFIIDLFFSIFYRKCSIHSTFEWIKALTSIRRRCLVGNEYIAAKNCRFEWSFSAVNPLILLQSLTALNSADIHLSLNAFFISNWYCLSYAIVNSLWSRLRRPCDVWVSYSTEFKRLTRVSMMISIQYDTLHDARVNH